MILTLHCVSSQLHNLSFYKTFYFVFFRVMDVLLNFFFFNNSSLLLIHYIYVIFRYLPFYLFFETTFVLIVFYSKRL